MRFRLHIQTIVSRPIEGVVASELLNEPSCYASATRRHRSNNRGTCRALRQAPRLATVASTRLTQQRECRRGGHSHASTSVASRQTSAQPGHGANTSGSACGCTIDDMIGTEPPVNDVGTIGGALFILIVSSACSGDPPLLAWYWGMSTRPAVAA